MKRRREELIKLKNLLFYRELKARQQGKIKSKTYRKILKKKREKQDESLNAQELSELDPEQAAQLLEKEELKRLEERMTQRHKKTNSKYSRNANMRDKSTRASIEEQQRYETVCL